MKKNLVLTASFVVASLFFNGCNNDEKEKFELSDSESKTYLLNKQNGELFFIDNKRNLRQNKSKRIYQKLFKKLKSY